jgi:hypothetical protein
MKRMRALLCPFWGLLWGLLLAGTGLAAADHPGLIIACAADAPVAVRASAERLRGGGGGRHAL